MNIPSPKSVNRSGTKSVGFAIVLPIVLPIVLLLVFGLVEFSRGSMIRNSMQIAAYEGARVAIIPGGTLTLFLTGKHMIGIVAWQGRESHGGLW